MAQNKTIETPVSVADFINKITDRVKREDSFKLTELIQQQSGFEPKMWGPAIIGFDSYHYRYESGREGDMPLVSFSPRAGGISLYIASNFEKNEQLLNSFGKYKKGKGCININKLADINTDVLTEMVANAIVYMQEKHAE